MSQVQINQTRYLVGVVRPKRSGLLALIAFVVFSTSLVGVVVGSSQDAQAQAPGAGSALGYQLPSDGYRVPPAGEEIVQASIELTVVSLANLNNQLFFPSMQIDLGPFFNNPFDIEGGHIGPQNVGGRVQSNWGGYFREYTNPDHRYTPFFNQGPAVPDENRITPSRLYNPDPGVDLKVGHFDPGTYTQVNTRPQSHFDWQVGRTYKMTVYRGDQKEGFWTWHGWIDDLTAGQSYYIGALYSTRPYIAGFGAWVETGISGNDPLSYEVVFSNPQAVATNGTTHRLTPTHGGASGAPNSVVYAPDKASYERSATVHHVNNRPVPANAYIRADAADRNWRVPEPPGPGPTTTVPSTTTTTTTTTTTSTTAPAPPVMGRVEGEIVRGGLPAADVVVDLFTDQRASFLGSARTAADGSFGFDLDPGCYVATFVAPLDETFAATGTPFQNRSFCVEPGATTAGVDGRLVGGADSAIIGGTVTDGVDEAVGVKAVLYDMDADGSRRRFLRQVFVDDGGTYRFVVDVGCHVVDLVAPAKRVWVESGTRYLQHRVCSSADELIDDLGGQLR